MSDSGEHGHGANWCVHYRATIGPGMKENKTCEAGVEYTSFDRDGKRLPHDRWPCFLDKGQSRPGAVPCEHLRRPTPDEIAKNEAFFEKRFRMMAATLRAIEPWRKKHKGKSFAEVIECPACNGRLHLSISSYNNHVHGRCETDGCVSWME